MNQNHKTQMAAEKRLSEEAKNIKGLKQTAIRDAVLEALCSFCRQSEEFSRAVEESGKSFGDCLNEVVKGIGTSISDIEAYRRAVRFYFPGADVDMELTVRMSEFEKPQKEKQTSGELHLSLMDIL